MHALVDLYRCYISETCSPMLTCDTFTVPGFLKLCAHAWFPTVFTLAKMKTTSTKKHLIVWIRLGRGQCWFVEISQIIREPFEIFHDENARKCAEHISAHLL